MAANGDLIELVHEQTYLGQVVYNVYHFQAAVADASLVDLAAWFETNVVPDVRGVQADLVTHTNLRLRNVFNDGETHEEPLTGVGTVPTADTELPSFMAYQIRLDHATGNVRPGFKRYTGVVEGALADGLVGGAVLTALQTLATQLLNPLSPALASWVHVVANRVCEVPNPDPEAVPSCLKYRLPENLGELNLGYIDSASVYTQPTSQNSRKWYT